MKFTHGILLTALAVLTGGQVLAESPVSGEVQLDTVEKQLESSKAVQDRLAADIAAALAGQEAVAGRLIAISARLQAQEAAIASGEAELLRLNKDEVVILSDLAAKQDVLSELLAGLQRLEQNPPPALVVEPNDVLAALRGAMMFGTIVPEMRAEADALAQSLARLEQVRAGIKLRKQTVRSDIQRLEALRGELAVLVERKQALVASGHARLEGEQKRTAELAARATTLKQLLKDLAAERRKAKAEAARLAEAAELERLRQEDEKLTPRLAFAEARARLDYPVQGQILIRFGDDDGLGSKFRGLAVATRDGAQVTTPADGRVEFAGAFRSYGEVLILNAGSGYHVLLAGLNQITAATGEFLRAGEPVGIMGNGPSSVTLLGDRIQDGRPVLYIEFRNNGEAVDSSPWWIDGVKEARG